MKPWYPSLVDLYGSQLVVAGKPLPIRQVAALTGISVGSAAPFMRWFVETHHPQLAALRSSGAPRGMLGDSGSTPDLAGPSEAASEPSLAPKVKPDHFWVDERSGTVFTDLGREYGIITFTQGEFRSIKRDYSKHYGGRSLTRQEIALRYKFPTIHAFEIFGRIHELRQNGLPFTDEELIEEGPEALSDKAIESERQAFFLKLQEKQREQIKRDAEKWQAFESSARAVVAELSGSLQALQVAPLAFPAAQTPFAAVIGLTDEHFGRLAFDHEGREVYNLKIAAATYEAAARDLAGQLQREGRPERIFLVAGSDGTHFDGASRRTANSTEQQAQSTGTYREVVSTYVRSVLSAALMLSQIAPVEIVVVGGNHDRETAGLVGMMLEFATDGTAGITVRNSLHPRTYIEFGANTLCFEHGDGVSPGKRQADAPRMFMVETAEQGVPLHANRIVFSGDLHAEMINDLGGVQYIVMPSLARGADSWHRQSRYVGTSDLPAMYIVRRKGGKGAIRYADPDALRAS